MTRLNTLSTKIKPYPLPSGGGLTRKEKIMQRFKKEIVKNGVTYTRIYEVWANGGRIFTASKQTSNEQKNN